jgi:hypothetical protein
VALPWLEFGQQARAPAHPGAAVCLNLDLAREHHQPRPLVNLVLLERLTGGQVDDNRARLAVGGDDPRRVRLDRQL